MPCAAAASPPSPARHPTRPSTSRLLLAWPGHDRPPAQEGRAPAHPARRPRRPEHRLAERAGGGPVTAQARAASRSPRPPPCGGTAACPSCRPSGADPRPRTPLRAPGAALHRPGQGPCSDRDLGRRAAGRSRSRSRRSARAFASRRSGSGPTRPSRAPRRACSPCSPSWPSWWISFPLASGDGLRPRRGTPSLAPPLSRRPGRRAPRDLARAAFGHVGAQGAPNKTPSRPARALGLRPLPRRLNGQSRA